VTIRYWKGQPLGVLLGCVREGPPGEDKVSDLVSESAVIGLGCEFVAPKSGTLYLRVNDSPAELADNVGQLTVTVVAK
jgi:hypothetical protein